MNSPWKHFPRKNKNPEQGDTEKERGRVKPGQVKRIALISLICVLLLGGTVGGILYYRERTQKKVEVFSVGTLNSASWWEDESGLTGTLTSDFVQSVKMKSGQEVEKIYVKAGDTVKVGDPLVKYNVEEQELDLQLKELQIKSDTLAIEKMQKELDKLKNTKTKGSLDGLSANALASAYHIPGMLNVQPVLLAENDTPEQGSGAQEATTEKKEDPPEEASSTEKKEDPPEEASSTEKKEDPPEASTEKKEDPPEASTEKKEDPSEGTTSSEATTEKSAEKDVPTSRTITSLDQRAKLSSGDGKTEKTPYVFLLVKKEVEATDKESSSEATTQAQKVWESIDISGELINTLIEKKIYAVFKEYDSLDAYEKKPGEPSSTITITPNTKFGETISKKAKYTIKDLKDLLVTISKLEITPAKTSVKTGNSYKFSAKVTGKNVKGLTAKWEVSGNKSKDTIISGGTLWVSSTEKAKKIKITVTVLDKKSSMTMSVKKSSSKSGGKGSSGGSGGSGSGGSGSGGDTDSGSYTAQELKDAIAEKEEELATAKTELSEAKINYEETKKEVEAATVKAKIAGKVDSACTLDSLPTDDSPIVVVRADEGIYVKTQINEMDLETVKVGGTIICTTFESGEQYEAVVKEVSDYPVTSSNTYTEGNPNSSFYPIVAYIENAEGLNPGDTVNIKYSSASMGTSDGKAIYIQKAYVRSDTDGSYVYKDGDKHRLEKQYIRTGKTLNGQYLEILEGITEEDYIAFPYGNNVKDGAKTKISENEENIIY